MQGKQRCQDACPPVQEPLLLGVAVSSAIYFLLWAFLVPVSNYGFGAHLRVGVQLSIMLIMVSWMSFPYTFAPTYVM